MADIKYLWPFILAWEGGYKDDPRDYGGPTNRGVTLKTWQVYGYDKDGDGDIDKDDLILITEYDAVYEIMKPKFWDRVQADKIKDQSVANIIVDWIWMSGFGKIKNIQRILDVKDDGIVGKKTLKAINDQDPKKLFSKIWHAREDFYKKLNNKTFMRGWMNRLNSIGYGSLKIGSKIISF